MTTVDRTTIFWYEIYDFDSDLWTTLNVVTPHCHIFFQSSGVSLKGNTYWCAVERNSDDDDYGIICFDFTKERFGSLLPLPFSVECDDYVTLSCVREEKLAVLLQHSEPYDLEIWITTKIESEEVLWNRFLRTEAEYDIYVSFISGSFFIDEEEKVAVGFEEGRQRVKIIRDVGYFRGFGEFGDQDENCWPHLCYHVPSLMQIKQPTGEGERKQQSNVAKRKYGQNMLTFVSQLKEEAGKRRRKNYYNYSIYKA